MVSTNRFVAETTFHIRYAETDAMGIVHHSSYIVYFEEGRSNYIRQRGDSYARVEQSGIYLTVSEIKARYIRPAQYDQRITVRCWVDAVRSRSLTFRYEIVDLETNSLLVTGLSKHICVTHEGNVTHLPAEWRQWAID